MKKLFSICIAVILVLFLLSSAMADRAPVEHDGRYIGAMRVVKCKQYVTLRESPYKSAKALAKVPLDAIVYNCSTIREKKSFLYCEYEGISGYILAQYLVKAPEYEPAVTSATTRKMTLSEVVGNGRIILDWKDYNISVVAAREYVKTSRVTTEVMRVGCFIDGEPLWGHEETIETYSSRPMLKTFIGGTDDDPMVMIYDEGYGLTMHDLLSGGERWTITSGNCNLGDAVAIAVGSDGKMYIAGSDGPDPVAISQEGRVIWMSDVGDPNVYGPYEITVKADMINVKYHSGMKDGYIMASFDHTGELLSIEEMKEN